MKQMQKNIQKKDDGRYIIFYTFNKKNKKQGEIPCQNCVGTPN